MRSAKGEEGERSFCTIGCLLKMLLRDFLTNVMSFSTRTYTVPDPPGLFDGHVWPMYLKHRKQMADTSLDIRKSAI